MQGPALTPCSVSVNKKALMVSGKWPIEEWLDDDAPGKAAEW